MSISKSPHTQPQQNTPFAQADVNPDDMPQTVGTGNHTATDVNRDGAQTGSERLPRHTPPGMNPPKAEQRAVAYEETLTRRVSDDASRQGISNRSAQAERAGRKKVVSQRENVQAGVNHSGKTPPR